MWSTGQQHLCMMVPPLAVKVKRVANGKIRSIKTLMDGPDDSTLHRPCSFEM